MMSGISRARHPGPGTGSPCANRTPHRNGRAPLRRGRPFQRGVGRGRQSHHAFATLWARAGHRVFFVENTGFREPGWRDLRRVAGRLRRVWRGGRSRLARVPKGISVISPSSCRPPGGSFARPMPLCWRRVWPISCTTGACAAGPWSSPTFRRRRPWPLLDRLSPSLVVYDCVDNFYGLPSPPPNLAETEAALSARAGLVLTTSRTLYEDKKNLHANVVELHHGVSPTSSCRRTRRIGPAPLLLRHGLARPRLRSDPGAGAGRLRDRTDRPGQGDRRPCRHPCVCAVESLTTACPNSSRASTPCFCPMSTMSTTAA